MAFFFIYGLIFMLFRPQVLNARKSRLYGTVTLIQPSFIKHLAILISAFVVVSFAFLFSTEFDRTQKAHGYLYPTGGTIRLSSQQNGAIKSLLVHEGQRVKKGDLLAIIESNRRVNAGNELNESAIASYAQRIEQLNNRIQVLNQDTQAKKITLAVRLANRKSNLKLLSLQESKVQERITLTKQSIANIGTLLDSGYISQTELENRRDRLLSLEQEQLMLQAQQNSESRAIAELEESSRSLESQLQLNILDLQGKLSDLKLELLKAKSHSLTELLAPMDGIVTGLSVTAKQETQHDDHILTLLAEGQDLFGILYVSSEAASFVESGQAVKVRYAGFPYQKYGVFEAEVISISTNLIAVDDPEIKGFLSKPSYKVIVKLPSQFVGKKPLKIGMDIDADIILSSVSLLEWLFEPLFAIKASNQ
ncbi:HlyD family secretion protein [Shewanella marisflavi]|uniref:HlyD family secretion protein n=1 Tax=Shewanella marisflavi TaxID=260364 RepID=UPI003AAB2D04